MIEVGSIVKSKYTMDGHRARTGVIIKLGADSKLAQVYWPHSRSTGWVKCIDMEVISG